MRLSGSGDRQMSTSAEQVAIAFASACARRGLDLAVSFPVDVFNATAAADERLPDLKRSNALAVLVGNTRGFWPVFRAALADDPAMLQSRNPLDEYVAHSVTEAAANTGVRHELRWAHSMHPRPIPIQKLARQVGLAALAPSHLSVHPEFGPWIALRAVAIFDVAGPIFSRPPAREPCVSCAKPCVPALQRALASAGAGAITGAPAPAGSDPDPRSPDDVGMAADWQRWLAVRDSCPVGIAHRYSADQIAYHYTKARSLLTGSR
jgi:methylmalonic aciduria homocystinuria type C protein